MPATFPCYQLKRSKDARKRCINLMSPKYSVIVAENKGFSSRNYLGLFSSIWDFFAIFCQASRYRARFQREQAWVRGCVFCTFLTKPPKLKVNSRFRTHFCNKLKLKQNSFLWTWRFLYVFYKTTKFHAKLQLRSLFFTSLSSNSAISYQIDPLCTFFKKQLYFKQSHSCARYLALNSPSTVHLCFMLVLRATVRKYRPLSGKSYKIDFLHFLSINSF